MIRDNQREECKTSKPNISFREDPSIIEWLKEELGLDETAAAVRTAIKHTLSCKQKMHDLHDMHEYMQDIIDVSTAAKLLHKNPSTIRRMIYRKQIRATKIGGTWVIPVSLITQYLRPKVEPVRQD